MIKVVSHPLVQEELAKLRSSGIDGADFRRGMIKIGRWIGYEFAETLPTEEFEVETPLGISKGIRIKDKNNFVVVNVLRAAIPLVDGVLRVFPEAKCGVVGAWRRDEPPFPVEVNYIKLPEIKGKIVVVADPMLATGNTMTKILKKIEETEIPLRMVVFSVIAAEEGLKKVSEEHPEVEIYTCAVEKELNPDGYIIPGLGDAGDKAFGKPCG
ncbi:uracil phosphoribosyltransferase [Methanobacterium aggregans]|uniref:uracil phosphoribosyltransferase n=1 Tax=Methanobacterium aggregans TaxID=1615586 RepID=UPI001AE13976|nr:uracil phosphoribosyltransferase [Methanobacterium aggregans]MBP2046251.1 uracil phosphoribosyltransferase [Methanobacterium aggregans]